MSEQGGNYRTGISRRRWSRSLQPPNKSSERAMSRAMGVLLTVPFGPRDAPTAYGRVPGMPEGRGVGKISCRATQKIHEGHEAATRRLVRLTLDCDCQWAIDVHSSDRVVIKHPYLGGLGRQGGGNIAGRRQAGLRRTRRRNGGDGCRWRCASG